MLLRAFFIILLAQFANFVYDICCAQTKLGDKIAARTGVTEFIMYTHLNYLAV